MSQIIVLNDEPSYEKLIFYLCSLELFLQIKTMNNEGTSEYTFSG